MKHSEYMKKGKVLRTTASGVSGSELTTASGERVPFDVLVVGTGSTFSGPTTKEELLKVFQAGKHFILSPTKLDLVHSF